MYPFLSGESFLPLIRGDFDLLTRILFFSRDSQGFDGSALSVVCSLKDVGTLFLLGVSIINSGLCLAGDHGAVLVHAHFAGVVSNLFAQFSEGLELLS
jgi:hypothetical protein